MYITLDIGGTNTRLAGFTDTSLSKNTFSSFKTSAKYSEGIKSITSAIDEATKGTRLLGISISVAIPFDSHYHTVFNANLPDWNALKLLNDIKEKYGITPIITNDISAGAVGEALSDNNEDFIYLAWGTGFGGVTAQRKNSIYNIYEYEPGHMTLVENGRPCVCGKNGCLEAYIGGKAIETNYKKCAEDLNNDEWNEVLEYAAAGINNIMAPTTPHSVVLNGHIPIAHPDFLERLTKKTNRDSKWNVVFRESTIGDEAPLYGALKLTRSRVPVKIHKLES